MLIEDCPYCRVIRGELEVDRLYEDDLVLAFLYSAPVTPGHAVVIPKDHHASIKVTDPAQQAAMMRVGSELGHALMRAIDGDGFNLHVATGDCGGQGFPHTHMHVIPRCFDDGFSWNWRSVEYSDDLRRKILDGVARGTADETE